MGFDAGKFMGSKSEIIAAATDRDPRQASMLMETLYVSQDPVFEQNQREYLNYSNFDVYHGLNTTTQ